jgi:hypothetical protein
MGEITQKYIDFASKVSFFEFVQEEYRPSQLPVDALSSEIDQLQSRTDWDILSLSEYIRNNPKSFLIFQDIFQLLRFTNAQMIHFLFDISRMNTLNLESAFEYAVLNLKNDSQFRDAFLKTMKLRFKRSATIEDILKDRTNYPKEVIVAVFKMVVPTYVDQVQKDISLLGLRLAKPEFSDCPLRMANYLLDRLELNKALKSINVREYLRNKKIPLDTKGIHGNYLKLRVKRVLDQHGFVNIDSKLKEAGITTLPSDLASLFPTNELKGRVYCTEKYIQGVVKPVSGREKKFDLVIVVDGKPKHLFEMNFYTTEGTKIGINEGEYLELLKFVRENTSYQFHWITDGNYWLTEQGERRLKNLWSRFGEIYNLSTFEENLDSFS